MKLFKALSLIALAALTLSVQFTSSCNGVLSEPGSIDLDRPYSFLTGRNHPPDSEQPLESLKVLTYNTFLRPAPISWGDANQCRATEIGQELAKRADELDLVVLNESFAKDAVQQLADTVGKRFPYRVLRRPRADVLRTSGGLSLLSRHPIRTVYTDTFEMCAYDDCLSTKGFLHAVVELSETLRVNVLATHLDAGDSTQDRTARENQVATIRDYMDRRGVGKKWPTLLMGDMNVDGLREPEDNAEYRSTLAHLSKQPCRGIGGEGNASRLCGQKAGDVVTSSYEDWSFDAEDTEPVNSMNCVGRSLAPCDSPNEASNWKERRRLDYIFNFTTPTNASGIELRARSAEHLPFRDSACGTEYLSDHQAVRAEFDIRRPPLVDRDEAEEPTDRVADASEDRDDEADDEPRDDG